MRSRLQSHNQSPSNFKIEIVSLHLTFMHVSFFLFKRHELHTLFYFLQQTCNKTHTVLPNIQLIKRPDTYSVP